VATAVRSLSPFCLAQQKLLPTQIYRRNSSQTDKGRISEERQNPVLPRLGRISSPFLLKKKFSAIQTAQRIIKLILVNLPLRTNNHYIFPYSLKNFFKEVKYSRMVKLPNPSSHISCKTLILKLAYIASVYLSLEHVSIKTCRIVLHGFVFYRNDFMLEYSATCFLRKSLQMRPACILVHISFIYDSLRVCRPRSSIAGSELHTMSVTGCYRVSCTHWHCKSVPIIPHSS
jgi:hypothetical protein